MRRPLAPLLAALVFLSANTLAFATTFIVNVGGSKLTFTPQTLTIQPGDTVTFVNKGGLHNVLADDGSFRCARGCDGFPGGNGKASSTNWVANVTFPTPRKIGYFCEIHGAPGQGMFGTINVQAPQPPPPVVPAPLGGWALLAVLLVLATLAHSIGRRSSR
jgi:plastocyanin